MQSVGLVLEGDGMRGLFTAGVLDCLLDHNIQFDYIIGVSAGACHALSYITKQRGRNRRVNLDYLKRPDYLGLRCLVRERALFGYKLIFETIPNELDPLDYVAMSNNIKTLIAVATDCRTGKAKYFPVTGGQENMPIFRASSSIPLVAPMVYIKGKPYLDGGVADSIPLQKSIDDGNTKNLVVLTRPAGYQKTPSKTKLLYKAAYHSYPALAKALCERYENYNASLSLVNRCEQAGDAIVLRPTGKIQLDRFEKDREKLDLLYAEGYQQAENQLEKITKFLAYSQIG